MVVGHNELTGVEQKHGLTNEKQYEAAGQLPSASQFCPLQLVSVHDMGGIVGGVVGGGGGNVVGGKVGGGVGVQPDIGMHV